MGDELKKQLLKNILVFILLLLLAAVVALLFLPLIYDSIGRPLP
jgi:hypothetical protein